LREMGWGLRVSPRGEVTGAVKVGEREFVTLAPSSERSLKEAVTAISQLISMYQMRIAGAELREKVVGGRGIE